MRENAVNIERNRQVCIELSAKNGRPIWNSIKVGLKDKVIYSQMWRVTTM